MSPDTKPESRPKHHHSDSLLDTVGDNFPVPYHPFTRRQSQTSVSIFVCFCLRKPAPVSGPKMSRIPQPKPVAKKLLSLALHLPTRALTLSPSLPPSSTLVSSSWYARAVHIFKCPRSPDYAIVTPKRARSKMPALLAAAAPRHASLVGGLPSVPVARRYCRVPSPGSMPFSPGSNFWVCHYGLEPFLDTSFYNGNGEGPKVLGVLVLYADLEANDNLSLTVSYNSCGRVIPSMSIFHYASSYSNRLNTIHFFLGMRIFSIAFMVCNGSSLRLMAAGGWAWRWLHRREKGIARCCCNRGRTGSPSACMGEDVDYK